MPPGTKVLGEYVLGVQRHAGSLWRTYAGSDRGARHQLHIVAIRRDVVAKIDLAKLREQWNAIVDATRIGGLMPVMASGIEHDTLFVVTEEMQGETLADRLAATPSRLLSTFEVARMLLSASEPLARLHAAVPAIAHEALEPRALSVSRATGAVRIADAGIVSALRRAGLTALDRDRSYAAPEHFDEGRPIGPAVDQFVLASIAHECLTGERAFSSDEAGVNAMMQGTRPALPTSVGDRRVGLMRALHRAWSPHPEVRYPSVAAFAADFARSAGLDPTAPIASLRPPPESVPITSLRPVAAPPRDLWDIDDAASGDDSVPADEDDAEIDEALGLLGIEHTPSPSNALTTEPARAAMSPQVAPAPMVAPAPLAVPPPALHATAPYTAKKTLMGTAPLVNGPAIQPTSPYAATLASQPAASMPSTSQPLAPLPQQPVIAPPRIVASPAPDPFAMSASAPVALQPLEATPSRARSRGSRTTMIVAGIALVAALGAGGFVIASRTRNDTASPPPVVAQRTVASPTATAPAVVQRVAPSVPAVTAHAPTPPTTNTAPPSQTALAANAPIAAPSTPSEPVHAELPSPVPVAHVAPAPLVAPPPQPATPNRALPRLTVEPTFTSTEPIRVALQDGINQCTTQHGHYGRHVFVGLAFEQPGQGPTTVRIAGAPLRDAMTACIEAVAHTTRSPQTVPGRWQRSFHPYVP